MKKIFEYEYDAESLYDIQRDIIEAFDEDFNPEIKNIPMKEGLMVGTFKVTIVWNEEN